MSITKRPFGTTADGKAVDCYVLTNANGVTAEIITYGGTLIRMMVPDKAGKMGDVVLGHDTLAPYTNRDTQPYFGALIGRYGNRIGKGKFALDGKEYTLATNNGENHLHGGLDGFDRVVWDAEVVDGALKLSYFSKDGEEGYPGNLKVVVVYTLTNDNELKIDYTANTDKKTVCNLTHHSYFNLGGHDSGDVLGHEMMINADFYTPTDEGSIPTGAIAPVEGTPMDFRTPTAIGARVNEDFEALNFAGGYDHNWVLKKVEAGKLSKAAEVYEPKTGRVMEVFTDQPGMQFYGGNFLDGSFSGKDNVVYNHRNAFCLETQCFPDSPNKSQFPTTTLLPGQTYTHVCIYKFSAR